MKQALLICPPDSNYNDAHYVGLKRKLESVGIMLTHSAMLSLHPDFDEDLCLGSNYFKVLAKTSIVLLVESDMLRSLQGTSATYNNAIIRLAMLSLVVPCESGEVRKRLLLRTRNDELPQRLAELENIPLGFDVVQQLVTDLVAV